MQYAYLARILERIGAQANVPIDVFAEFTGQAIGSVRNSIGKKTFPLEVVRVGGRCFVRPEDLAHFLQFGIAPREAESLLGCVRIGTRKPSKAEIRAAAEEGLNVSEWRSKELARRIGGVR